MNEHEVHVGMKLDLWHDGRFVPVTVDSITTFHLRETSVVVRWDKLSTRISQVNGPQNIRELLRRRPEPEAKFLIGEDVEAFFAVGGMWKPGCLIATAYDHTKGERTYTIKFPAGPVTNGWKDSQLRKPDTGKDIRDTFHKVEQALQECVTEGRTISESVLYLGSCLVNARSAIRGLTKENETLKANQVSIETAAGHTLSSLKKERDDLRARLDAARNASEDLQRAFEDEGEEG